LHHRPHVSVFSGKLYKILLQSHIKDSGKR
jgi:hypothetical protein